MNKTRRLTFLQISAAVALAAVLFGLPAFGRAAEKAPSPPAKKNEPALHAKILTEELIASPGKRSVKREVSKLSKRENAVDNPMTAEERENLTKLAYLHLKQTSPGIIEKYFERGAAYEQKKLHLLACYNYLQMLSLKGLPLETKYEIEKKLRLATDRVNLAIEKNSENVRAGYRDAFTLTSLGDWEESLEAWKNYLAQVPGDEEVKRLLTQPEYARIAKEKEAVNKARALWERGDERGANQALEEALKLNPESRAAAELSREMSRKEEEESRRKEIARLLSRSQNLIASGKEEQAFEALLDAFKLDPNDNQILGQILQIQKVSNRQKELMIRQARNGPQRTELGPSVEAQAARPSRDPRKAETHYQRGLVYYGLRNFRDALSEWQIATQLDPSHLKALRALERVKSDLKAEE